MLRHCGLRLLFELIFMRDFDGIHDDCNIRGHAYSLNLDGTCHNEIKQSGGIDVLPGTNPTTSACCDNAVVPFS